EDDAVELLQKYRWNGNVRQLRNIAEQISVLEQERNINATILREYLPGIGSNLPAVIQEKKKDSDFSNEREILYKVLFDMKSDLHDLKKLTLELMENDGHKNVKEENESLIKKIYGN
ncbi:sigma-54-dependent Fis family transcriptional regulator, partial [Salinimicrobium sp. CDJ15-91]|nr:sigma-54-dependent Fis family transcriptional regulator [Salinimicrobium oceani]